MNIRIYTNTKDPIRNGINAGLQSAVHAFDDFQTCFDNSPNRDKLIESKFLTEVQDRSMPELQTEKRTELLSKVMATLALGTAMVPELTDLSPLSLCLTSLGGSITALLAHRKVNNLTQNLGTMTEMLNERYEPLPESDKSLLDADPAFGFVHEQFANGVPNPTEYKKSKFNFVKLLIDKMRQEEYIQD